MLNEFDFASKQKFQIIVNRIQVNPLILLEQFAPSTMQFRHELPVTSAVITEGITTREDLKFALRKNWQDVAMAGGAKNFGGQNDWF